MALSLNDVTQATKKKKATKKKPSPPEGGALNDGSGDAPQPHQSTSAKPTTSARPWRGPGAEQKRETLKSAQQRKFNRRLEREIPVTNAEQSEGLPHIDWYDQAHEFVKEIHKDSHLIYRLKEAHNWVKAIEIYPKLKIPLPKFLISRDD